MQLRLKVERILREDLERGQWELLWGSWGGHRHKCLWQRTVDVARWNFKVPSKCQQAIGSTQWINLDSDDASFHWVFDLIVLRLLSPLSILSVYQRDCRDDNTPFTSTVPMTFWIGWISLLLVISSICPWNIHHRYDSCHLIGLPKGLIRTTHFLHWIALPTLSLQYSLTLDPTP